jgi:hypothetical protein
VASRKAGRLKGQWPRVLGNKRVMLPPAVRVVTHVRDAVSPRQAQGGCGVAGGGGAAGRIVGAAHKQGDACGSSREEDEVIGSVLCEPADDKPFDSEAWCCRSERRLRLCSVVALMDMVLRMRKTWSGSHRSR